MSQQQISESTISLSGSTQPPQLFDNEPTIIIFDRNQYIVDRPIDLKPFNTIVNIINNENNLRKELSDLNGSFTVVCILPQWDHPHVQAFVQQDIIVHPNAKFFCLFFIDGQLTNMGGLGGHRLLGCYPITSRISAQTREICARANDLNINYCEDYRLFNEGQGDIGVANVYVRQRDYRLSLQLAYNEQLQREFEQRLLG